MKGWKSLSAAGGALAAKGPDLRDVMAGENRFHLFGEPHMPICRPARLSRERRVRIGIATRLATGRTFWHACFRGRHGLTRGNALLPNLGDLPAIALLFDPLARIWFAYGLSFFGFGRAG